MFRWNRFALVFASTAALAACGSDSQPPATADAAPEADASSSPAVDLEGVWLVSSEGIPEGQTLTYEFGPEVSGSAQALVLESASGVTSCQAVDYALLADGNLLLGSSVVAIEVVSADELILSAPDGTQAVTLTRVAGEPPIEPCRELQMSFLGWSRQYVSQYSKLNAHGGNLYFSSDIPGEPIVTYGITEQEIVEERGYAPAHAVIGVVDDTLMFGGVFAGRSDTIDRFDLGAGTHELSTLTTQQGEAVSIFSGHYDRDEQRLMVAVRSEEGENLLLTVDPTTMAVESQQPFLPSAYVQDISIENRTVMALVNHDTVVTVGQDGLATESIKLSGLEGPARGIALVGPTLYVMVNVNGRAAFHTATLQ